MKSVVVIQDIKHGSALAAGHRYQARFFATVALEQPDSLEGGRGSGCKRMHRLFRDEDSVLQVKPAAFRVVFRIRTYSETGGQFEHDEEVYVPRLVG